MASNRDLEFALKFKNQASSALSQVRKDLKALGVDLKTISSGMASIATSSAKVQNAVNGQALASQKADIAAQRLTQQQKALELQNVRLAQTEAALMLRENQLALQSDRLLVAQQRLEQQKKRLAQQTGILGGAFGNLLRQFLPFTVAAAAFQGIRMADEFRLLQARIGNATKETGDAAKAFAGLKDIARQTGTGLEGTVNIFQRLSQVRKEIHATTDEMLQFTDTVSKLGVISGASPDALKFGLTQLGQSLSSNLVRAEEFNSIMENIPEVGKAIAEEFGITTGQLRNLVINGKVLSADVFAAIINQSQRVNEEFEKFPLTVGRAWQGFLIDLQDAIGLMDKATGASNGLAKLIQFVGKNIGILANAFAALANVIQAMGIALYAQFLRLFNFLTSKLTTIINTVGEALHKFFKTDFKPIDLRITGPDGKPLTDSDIITEVGVGVREKLNEAINNVNNGAAGVNDVLGIADPKVQEKRKEAIREIGTDYKKLAALLGTKGDNKQKSFYADLAEKIALLKEETLWVGKSNEAKERALAIAKVQQDAIKAGVKDFDVSAYAKAYDDLARAKKKVHEDFATGFQAAMQNMKDNAQGLGDLAGDILQRSVDGIDNTIKGLVTGSIKSFKDLQGAVGNILGDLAADIASFVVKQTALNAIFGLFGGGGGITWNSPGTASVFGGVQKYAKGGVTNGPEIFPDGNGVGMRGEAGKEGILPLKRLANGDLGVQAMGAGGGGMTLNYMPTFMLDTNGGSSSSGGSQSAGGMDGFMRVLNSEVKKTTIEVIQEQQRPGGLLAGGRGRAT